MVRWNRKLALSLLLIGVMLVSAFAVNLGGANETTPKPLNVIIVWHQHQPFYYDPVLNVYTRPWVRLHAANDYWKMAHYLSEYPEVHATIDLSGSLIAQIVDYMNGREDTLQLISYKIANGAPLSLDEKWQVLQVPGGFFDHTIPWNGEPVTDRDGNPTRKFWRHYTELKDKLMNAKKKYSNLSLEEQKVKITGEFTEQDYVDLAVYFNLAWIDYGYIVSHPELKAIYDRVDEGNYTREDLKTVLNAQMWLLNHTFEEHERINLLLGNGNVEVTVVPYAHPIGPILNDFGWEGDFDAQVKKADELYREYIGNGTVAPRGGWAAESALNDKTLEILADNGWEWVMTDQMVLERMGIPKTVDNYYHPWVAQFGDRKIYLFPRNHDLSDRVGFRYAGMNQYQAVEDFVNELLKIQKQNYDGSLVYVITLDGENPWEHYPYDGQLFLTQLYKRLTELQEAGLIRTLTPSEYIQLYGDKAKVLTPKMMERLDFTSEERVKALLKAQSLNELYDMAGINEEMQWPESSWIDGTLSTWIGEPQENYAWYWLYLARKTLMEHNASMGLARWENANEYLLRAEGSDWFWWYGKDQDSGQDYAFDRYFKAYLYEIYRLANVTPPDYLYGNYYPDGEPYLRRALDGLKEGQVRTYSSLSPLAENVSVYFDGEGLHFVLNGNLSEFEVSLYEVNRHVGNTFTLLQSRPDELSYSTWPFSKDSVGLMITKHIVYRNGTAELYNATDYDNSTLLGNLTVKKTEDSVDITVPFDNLESPSDFYFAVSTVRNGSLEVISTPVELKLPTQVKGAIIADIKDPEGDDHGPGTYTYPTDGVFKPGVFDLLRFRLLEGADGYIMEFYFKNLGDNPWNGPNGFSLQIIEVYLDYKPGGNTSAIKMFPDGPGANVNLDPEHPWDVAFRIAGWDYGNLIVLPNGTVYQGEMKISTDPTKNAIIVKIPKKYIKIDEDYGLWGDVLTGSQDGYGPDKWRPVAVTAEQWKVGGGDPDAIIAGVEPRVMDELVPPGFKPTQEQQLSSYDAENGKRATVKAISLLKTGIVVKDPEGDDHGPGTYTYPTDPVFVPGAFDLLKFKMVNESDYWHLEFYFKDLGDNPWNGPNGFSLQIIEAYFDFKDGGNTSAIKMFPDGPGANVDLDPSHPWDLALRIAGWDYGNLIVLPNGTVYQGEMKISADPTKNAIIVELPKRYLRVNREYGLYASILTGSQDGYGPDKWRPVAVTAEQWKVGGGDPDAIIAGVEPRVMDELVPPGFKPTQEQQLSSYDAENGKRATVLMITLIKGTSTGGGTTTTTTTPSPTTTTTTSTTTISTTTTTSSSGGGTSSGPTTTTTSTTTTSTTTTTTTPTTTTTSTTTSKKGGWKLCGPAVIVGLALMPLLLRRKL
ncbi:glucodextranase DOMON-like domain-containing protein [Thermococcus gammatolerans]|uniref:Amylopullulanase (Apu) n=1 Tax=Thermococcus gammatolerans (strain DSM 15229 / JCM 11827 / EJ3) TaxID=593117 RepID=C5A4E3_THEGJ|nr:glucodextranase DOMON-like domain-containing protein [Thermococcus gammatolerans]ACS33105.1 Amylopullulanase (Apu) [Thermococcus gammatolerans EJ3]